MFIINFSWASNNSSQHRSIKHKLYWKSTNYVLSQLCNYNSSSFQEGSRIRAFLASPHTQTSYSLLRLLALTAYTWAKSFNQKHRKIGAYSFASQHIHLKGDVNNNDSCSPISNWIYVPRSFLATWCLQKDKIKRNREEYFDSYIKVKDRPFAEGSKGCHAAFLFLCHIP